MYKAIKIRLYPNRTQAEQFNKLLGCYRFVYNNCLDRKINSYKENQVTENLSTLGHYFHNELTKKEEYSWLKEQNTKILKQSIIDMLDAYKHFFNEHKGFPKFKSKHDRNLSCRFPVDTFSRKNIYLNKKISLANIKNISFRCSKKHINQLQESKDNIKSATLLKTCSGNFFLSILIDLGDVDLRLSSNSNSVGIDLGVKDFVITSDGEVFNNPHFKKSKTNQIKRLQRQLSKKQKGSNNRNKARIKLAKVYEHIANRKQNYLHNITTQLVNENQVICIEDLNVKGMLKNHCLSEAIQEMNFGEFRRLLEYKCQWYGRDLAVVDRFYPSSKTCHVCGYKYKDIKLSVRDWTCPICKTHHDRDNNAAMNILRFGLNHISAGTVDYTGGEEVRANLLKGRSSAKPEAHESLAYG